MKYIAVQWQPQGSGYTRAMIVVCSNHPRFTNGSRFYFGFLEIASCEGYAITVLPSQETLDDRWVDGYLVKGISSPGE
jgi:hypothetical protein